MEIMQEKSESSQQPKGEQHVTVTVADQIQLIEKKLLLYSAMDQKPLIASCNYRVPERRREGNEDAYTPRVVSIGPIHHGRPHLQAMERYKWKFLGIYLEGNLFKLADLVCQTIDFEDEARMSYLDTFDNISSREFSEMIMLDFVFMIELFFRDSTEFDDPRIRQDIAHDMMLLENQLPQRLVTHLYGELYTDQRPSKLCSSLILEYFQKYYITRSDNQSAMHWRWDVSTDMLDFLVKCHDYERQQKERNIHDHTEILSQRTHSATELQEAGVKFSKAINDDYLLDVKFRNGVLEIPVIRVNSLTETLFLNMIASEQSRRDTSKIVSGYIYLMGILIRRPKDVVLLRNCGVIESYLDDDEQVTRVFNNLSKGIVIDREGFYFVDLYESLHKYSKNNWHQWKGSWFKWMRMLRRDYFSNPWTIISVIAAFILLVLTVIQTVCAIIQL